LLGCAALALAVGAPSKSTGQNGEDCPRASSGEQSNLAVDCHRSSVQPAADSIASHLLMAAECHERGDEITACLHLSRHLDAHPDHPLVRFRYAESLLRVGRVELARLEFQRFLQDTEDGVTYYAPETVRSHQRLSEIAVVNDEPYLSHL